MTPTEILHKIVETENKARNIYDEAVAMQTGFDAEVQTDIAELRKKYAAIEESDVAEAEREAVVKSDAEIERLDRKLEAELAAARGKYERSRSYAVEKIFRLAVNLDA